MSNFQSTQSWQPISQKTIEKVIDLLKKETGYQFALKNMQTELWQEMTFYEPSNAHLATAALEPKHSISIELCTEDCGLPSCSL